MNFVTLLPNGVKCISNKSDELPEGSMTYGTGDEQHYDGSGNILPDFKKLPKFSKKLFSKPSKSSLDNDLSNYDEMSYDT